MKKVKNPFLDEIPECFIPNLEPDFVEISRYMRINVDILKNEISDHIDAELKRFNQEIQKIKEKE